MGGLSDPQQSQSIMHAGLPRSVQELIYEAKWALSSLAIVVVHFAELPCA